MLNAFIHHKRKFRQTFQIPQMKFFFQYPETAAWYKNVPQHSKNSLFMYKYVYQYSKYTSLGTKYKFNV